MGDSNGSACRESRSLQLVKLVASRIVLTESELRPLRGGSFLSAAWHTGMPSRWALDFPLGFDRDKHRVDFDHLLRVVTPQGPAAVREAREFYVTSVMFALKCKRVDTQPPAQSDRAVIRARCDLHPCTAREICGESDRFAAGSPRSDERVLSCRTPELGTRSGVRKRKGR